MSDIFKDMQVKVGCEYISDQPSYKRKVWQDPENEYLIQKAFEKLMQDKTVIMIAHRLSTIRNANKIIVMENGRLIESGKHNDLIQKNGRYAEMWKHYTEAIDWKVQTKVVQ